MSDASLALQAALYAALGGAASPPWSGVYDGPPADAVLPYVTIGPDLVVEASTKTEVRREHRFAVTVWAAADAAASIKPAMAAIEAAVLALPAAMPGHRIVTNSFVRSFTRRDPARGIVSGTCEFRARTERD